VAASHGAAAARTAYAFGRDGFPRPLHPHPAPWWHPRPAHMGAVAGTAAAVAAGVTWIAVPPHHGVPPAGGTTAGASGGARPALGNAGQAATPGAPGDTARASVTAQASVMPTASASAGGSSAPTSVTVQTSAPAPVSAPATTTSAPPGAGTLSVSPATLDVVPPASGSITLTASGGPVDWSVSEPPGLAKKVIVAPMSGTLAAGASTTVIVTVTGPGQMHVHLEFSPSGATVTVTVVTG